MKWFPDVGVSPGTYVTPPREATIEEMVDDGVLIAAAAVRLAVKNLIILRSARDRADYSPERVMAAVREELENLATEKDADAAARLREVGRRAAERDGQPRHHDDYRSGDTELLAKRAEVSERLATRLRELGDAEFCGELVDRPGARPGRRSRYPSRRGHASRLEATTPTTTGRGAAGCWRCSVDLADLENRER